MKNVLKKLLKAKKEMGTVVKGSKNEHFKSSYADLNAYLEVVDPVLESNGLLLLQPLVTSAEGDKISTRILDVESGEEVVSEMKLVSVKGTMQDLGSAVTYARRYTLASLLGLAAEDDDGEAATGRGKSNQQNFNMPKASASSDTAEVTETEKKVPSTSSFRKKVVRNLTTEKEEVQDSAWE
jgi:hypothetical protein